MLFIIGGERSFKHLYISRSSRQEVFCKKGVLGNFTKLAGKHLRQSLFFNKVAGPSPATLLKKRLWHRCFYVNFVEFLRTPFCIEHLWWLRLCFSHNNFYVPYVNCRFIRYFKKFKMTWIIIVIYYSKSSFLEFVYRMIWLSGAEGPY